MTAHYIARRQVLSLVGGLTIWATARPGRGDPAPTETEIPPFTEHIVSGADSRGSVRRAVVYVPNHLDPKQKHPAVVLLHGYAQARDEKRALASWKKEYGLLDAYQRLLQPPMSSKGRYLTESRWAEIGADVAKRPFAGSILICPMTPVLYFDTGRGGLLERFTRWLCDFALPAAQSLAPIDPERVGLGGVSMGGQVALEVLIRAPGAFSAFSGIMVAIGPEEVRYYANRVQTALSGRSTLPILVLTASADTYRTANDSLHRALRKRDLNSEYQCPPGIHTSDWMRDLGCLETLLWHDRRLQGT